MATLTNKASYAQPKQEHKVPWQLLMIKRAFRMLGKLSPTLTARLALSMFFTPRRSQPTAKGSAFMQTAKQFSVPFPTGPLAAYQWGDGDRTVLTVHGWESNASQLRVIIEKLLDAGYRVVAFDAPAHGNSPGKQTNIIMIGEALQAVIEQVGPVYAIVAHSAGAASTLYHLATNPNLNIEKLVLNGSPAGLTHIFNQYASIIDLPQPVVDAMLDQLFQRFGRPLERFSLSALASRITTPTMLLHDRHDEYIDYAQGLEISSNWPDAKFVSTSGLGHRGALHNPETVSQILSFLNA